MSGAKECENTLMEQLPLNCLRLLGAECFLKDMPSSMLWDSFLYKDLLVLMMCNLVGVMSRKQKHARTPLLNSNGRELLPPNNAATKTTAQRQQCYKK